MGGAGKTTFAKREREKIRHMKQREKEERRLQRKVEQPERCPSRDGEDPDLAGLHWGPQAPLY